MYGIVLATMLTAGGEAPNWGHGCHGCWSSCHGCRSCYGGCGSSSCHGCWSSCHGCQSSCHGCYSSCYGSSCHGCYSSCNGCYSSCNGCYSSCNGCYSSCNGCYSSCNGCYSSCNGCYSSCHGCSSVIVVPAYSHPQVVVVEKAAPHVVLVPTVKQATVTIQVADGASLSIDGTGIAMAAAAQTFVTPELEPSRVYFYEMKASAKKDGKELSVSKKVAVRAGEKVTVDLRDLKPWKAPNPEKEEASLSVKLPADAKLYVDGVLCPLTTAERKFETPPLVKGKQFNYTLKAEVVREGKTLTETKRVPIEAGQNVSVEFGTLAAVTASR